MRRSVVHAFGFGGALGLWEAVHVLLGLPHVKVSDALSLLVYGWLGYGLVCAVVAVPIAIAVVRGSRAHAAVATGVAIATVATTVQIRALAGYHDVSMAWLMLGCAALGGVLGTTVGWCVAAIRPTRVVAAWRISAVVAVLMGLASMLSGISQPAVPAAHAEASGPNVLLISVDTLRIDRLGCYGRTPTLTPHLDALARQGVLFETAMSPVALTGPSHTTMLTGLYPFHHGATTNGIPISPNIETVAETLVRAGYRTAGFVSGWPLTDASSKLASRFQVYDDNFSTWPLFPDAVSHLALAKLAAYGLETVSGRQIERNERAGERTVAHALDWISHQRDSRFFAFVHLYEPHAPYAPPQEWIRRLDPEYRGSLDAFRPWGLPPDRMAAIVRDPREVEHIEALYSAEVAYADTLVGRLLDGLTAAGLSDDTLVIFTADHGESMTEHGTYFDHDEYLYDTYVHVPLIVRFPDGAYAGSHRSEQVRLVDLTPTVLEIVGVEPRVTLDGSSLVAVAEGREGHVERIAYGSIAAGFDENARSRYYVRSKGYKLIWTFDRRESLSQRPVFEELYDLADDPGELHNLILGGRRPAVLAELRRLLAERVRQRTSKRVVLDAEVRRRLHSLGYL